MRDLLRRPYVKVVAGTPEDGFLAEAPELPGCFTAGETEAEALALLNDAMAGWLELALERGEPIPAPRAEQPDDEYSGRFMLRLPKSLHRQAAEQAQRDDTSLNQLVVTLVAQGLGARSPSATNIAERRADYETTRTPAARKTPRK